MPGRVRTAGHDRFPIPHPSPIFAQKGPPWPDSFRSSDVVPTPALVLDLDRFDANMAEIVALATATGVEFLPHAKTHRTEQLGLRQIAAGADGLCVAGELAKRRPSAGAGVRRLFVAFPIVGERSAARALTLAQQVDLTLGTDSLAAAQSIGPIFAAAGARARLLLAVDTGIGREGVAPEDAPAIAAQIQGVPGVELIGVYTHEGSTYQASTPDELVALFHGGRRTDGPHGRRDPRGRGAHYPGLPRGLGIGQKRRQRRRGHRDPARNSRSTTLGTSAQPNATAETTAVRVVATVVSHAAPDRALFDAGSKSLSGDLVPASAHRGQFPGMGLIVDAPGWIVETLSEEHGWLRWGGAGSPRGLSIGMRLEIIPGSRACMAFGMLRRSYITQGGELTETWDAFGPGSSE